MDASPTSEPVELALLQEALAHRWGLDFRRWRPTAFRRRVRRFVEANGCAGPADLIPLVLRSPDWRDALVASLARRHEALFRDPGTWRVVREEVVPRLRTWPRVRIWVPGCARGDDVWSLAILLQEEGLSERTQIWATGMSRAALDECRAGAWPDADFEAWAANHRASGARDELARWRIGGDGVRLDPALMGRVCFAVHHLDADGPHNQFHAIVCRDVLLDYSSELAGRVWRGLHASLVPFGALVLGRGERLGGTPHAADYRPIDADAGVWRRAR